jgi:uncharacterized protein (DUF1697 family)
MSDLRRMLAGLGLSDGRSLLQSGNLVFRRDSRGEAVLVELLLETEARNRLGLETNFFVRSAREWSAVVANNPFRDEVERDPSHLLVMFTITATNPRDVDALQASIGGPEVLRAHNRHLYIVYPTGIGRSRLTNALLERILGTRATARNWNTVLKLAATVPPFSKSDVQVKPASQNPGGTGSLSNAQRPNF